ncbi:MAG: insulinase family protein [Acidimicrobiia bacterium]|nr:insulinase family protein [Acidimicrobiia bacterium]
MRPLLLLLTLAGSALAAPPAAIPPVRFTDTKLENGLRVLIAEDRHAPIFGIAVSYAVGSKDERAGRTGFAHLFEHMMFKGSQNVGAGEHFFLIYNNGGSMNGTTNTDRTLYFEVLPKNQLDLALFLEADRMRSLEVTKENLENQRQAVKEERRLRMDNQPYGRSNERITELAYDNFAYKHSVIGSMEDLDAASVEDVHDFFRTYYAPNNAVLALVGDLDTKTTLEKVKKFFGDIPRQEAPQKVDLSEKPQEAERRERIEDRLARLSRIDMVYRISPGNHADTSALQLGAAILSSGDSSRLYQKLVREKQVAAQVFGFVDERMGPGLYRLIAIVRPGKTVEEVESHISEEIARMHAEPVTENELERARSMIRRSAAGSRASSLGRAIRLADDAVLYNDPGRLNRLYAERMAVTAPQIQAAVKTHWKQANRTVIVTVPAAAATKSGAKSGGKQ